ncbi:MAG TPA: glycosyl transferase [Planctomycetaceae bacterium]|nr:glycosyl transferase [Planctomycetaceae bacterium]
MKTTAFIITLKRAVERLPQVERIRTACPIRCETLEAVDGRGLTDEQRSLLVSQGQHRPRYPFTMRDGEVGVFMSHRKAWQEIISRDLDAGLILEDDLEIDVTAFGNAWDLALKHVQVNDYIKFPVPKRNRGFESAGKPAQIQTPTVIPLGATSQLVTRGAAKQLLALTEKFDRPVDTFIQMNWVTGITPRIVSPSGITEVSHLLGGSTIQKKDRPLRESIYRNVKRPTYRLKVCVNAYWHAISGSKQNTSG